MSPTSQYHDRLDIDSWIAKFPLSDMPKERRFGESCVGPVPIAYIEQIRSLAKTGEAVGEDVDLCIWNLGDSMRRDTTKIGGVPYWPIHEPWPGADYDKPFTFLAQFCFRDSLDILPRLPGDILSILSEEDDHLNLTLYWFKFSDDLLPIADVPAQRWSIQPCHAQLHRTTEWIVCDHEIADRYDISPLAVSGFRSDTKIGGTFYADEMGELAPLDNLPVEEARAIEVNHVVQSAHSAASYVCQLGSIEASDVQPFVNVRMRDDVIRDYSSGPDGKLLMISDVGGHAILWDGERTDSYWWSG